MRRAYLLVLVVFGLSTATFAQALPSDSQTLQALLIEVRELRQGLLSSLARVQSAQILLSCLQNQQAAALRASDRLNDARLRLAEAQTHQRDVRNNLKRLEDALGAEESPVRQKELREMINRSKSELEDSTDLERRQTTEIEAEQQLRVEQEKLTVLEGRLDELVRKLDNPVEQSSRGPH